MRMAWSAAGWIHEGLHTHSATGARAAVGGRRWCCRASASPVRVLTPLGAYGALRQTVAMRQRTLEEWLNTVIDIVGCSGHAQARCVAFNR